MKKRHITQWKSDFKEWLFICFATSEHSILAPTLSTDRTVNYWVGYIRQLVNKVVVFEARSKCNDLILARPKLCWLDDWVDTSAIVLLWSVVQWLQCTVSIRQFGHSWTNLWQMLTDACKEWKLEARSLTQWSNRWAAVVQTSAGYDKKMP